MCRRTPSSPRTRIALTRLEDRTVPAVTAALAHGVLSVLGDGAANQISVALVNGQVTVSGVAQTFAATAVAGVTVDGGDGDDVITVSPALAVSALLFGGYGADRLTGGSGHDELFGGPGNDTLDGGAGDDQLAGGSGTDAFADAQGANTTSQTAGPARTTGMSGVEGQILALVNQHRQAAGLAPLAAEGRLNFAAAHHSQNMANLSGLLGLSGAMAHTLLGSPLPTLLGRADYAGYEYQMLGENIAYGYTSPAAVVQAWMESPGHRANILNANFTEIGIAVRATAGGVLYYTQEFGRPMPGAPPAPPPPVPPPPAPARHLYAVGASTGGGPQVLAYDAATGAAVFNFMAYDPAFRGGVRVATGDVTGDGYDDIVTAPGTGGGPHVKVYDGATGRVVREWLAYEGNFFGGLYLAVGDVTGDGRADVVTGPGVWGGPLVKVWNGADGRLLSAFYAYDSSFRGGTPVAAGDVTGDGRADVVTGTGPGGGAHVKVFDGRTLALYGSFFAFDPAFRGGATVAAGDVNGDGRADVIAGAGPGGGPNVRVISGTDFALLENFYAYPVGYGGGVRVAAIDLDGNGRSDILVGSGAGLASHVVGYQGETQGMLRHFVAYDPRFTGGVFVG
jgi:uncharacterized protein YkwD